MKILRWTLPPIALLLLGAHFLRATQYLPAALAVGAIGLLFVRTRWAPRALQAVLALGVLEWLLTLAQLAAARQAAGQPWLRMTFILGAVALLTAAAVWLAGRAPALSRTGNARPSAPTPSPPAAAARR